MVRHIVMWNFQEGFSAEKNVENAQKMKSELEPLTSIVEGIISLEVIISALASGNMVLNSLFADDAALIAYQTHPEHIRIGKFVGAVMTNRTYIDY